MDDSPKCGDKSFSLVWKSQKRTKKSRLIRWITKKFQGQTKLEASNPDNEVERSEFFGADMEIPELTLFMNSFKKTQPKLLSKSTSDLCSPKQLLTPEKHNLVKQFNSTKSIILDPALLCFHPEELSKPTYLPIACPPTCSLGRRWRSCSGLDTYNQKTLDNINRSTATMTLSSVSNDPAIQNHSKSDSIASITNQPEPSKTDPPSTGIRVSSTSYSKFCTTYNSETDLTLCDNNCQESAVKCPPQIHSNIPPSQMPNVCSSACMMDYLSFLPDNNIKELTKNSSSNFLNPNMLIPCPLSSPLPSLKYPVSSSPLSSLSSSEYDSAIDEDWSDVKRGLDYKNSSSQRTECPLKIGDFMPPQVIVTDYDSSINQSDHEESEHLHSLDFLDSNPRKYSSSSICSDVSDYSTISTSSNEERPAKNHWKKIKNAVHWSPFLQHFKKNRYPWIQLAGHQGCFQAGGPGTILKKLNVNEQKFYEIIENDCLKLFVPESRGEILKDGEKFLQLEDLLTGFNSPCVMDIKMGVRTYLEEELGKARENPKLRTDMYQKMVEIDPNAPTAEEFEQKAITKPRYMQWRETISSSASLGFRIEGIKRSNGESSKDFKRTKTREQVQSVLKDFTDNDLNLLQKYSNQLKKLLSAIENSELFKDHEVIGSSLLFIHDQNGKAGIWLIDFGKTVPLPKNVSVTHRNPWSEGNHEDGYLFGMDNLISIIEELL